MPMDNLQDKKWLKLLADYDRHGQRIEKATMVKLGESQAEKNKRIKHLEDKYTRWFEYYFPHYAKCKSATFHDTLGNAVIKNKKIRMLAEMYRGSAKSTHLGLGIPLYLMYVKNDLRFMLLIGRTDVKAKKLISDIQNELTRNKRLQNDYGNRAVTGDWSNGDFVTADGVRFFALGFGSDPRGLREGSERPDYIDVDDVDTKKHLGNERLMTDMVEYIEEEIMGCFDNSDDCTERFVYANNNFHKKSITNRLHVKYEQNIKKAKLKGKNSNYKILKVCAVKDLVKFEPTWPEKTSAKYWEQLYFDNRRSFLRERMHIHITEGKMFKPEMMQHKKMLPLHLYDSLVLYGDLSYKEQGDYKAMVLVGKIGREKHIIHSFLRQVSRRNAAIWLYDLYEDKRLGEYNITYKIEGLFAQDEFINDFDEEGDTRDYYIPIVADKRPKEGKHDRVESILGFFERRNVWFNEDEKEDTDQVEAIEQFTSFEKGSKAHDDYPDAVHGAFRELEELSRGMGDDPATSSRADTHSQSKHRT
jgi:predicted phage terminase large subunit-like protein